VVEPVGQRDVGRELRVLLVAFALLAPAPALAGALPFGGTVEETIAPGEMRSFEVEAQAGTVLHLRVEHRHLDFAVKIIGPDQVILSEGYKFGNTSPVTSLRSRRERVPTGSGSPRSRRLAAQRRTSAAGAWGISSQSPWSTKAAQVYGASKGRVRASLRCACRSAADGRWPSTSIAR
jgi:hypothetical protein